MSDPLPDAPRLVRFGVYELDVHSGELRKSGARLSLQQQPLQLLSVLLERPGDLVTREELRKRLWPDDTFVDFEHGLNAAVKRLRDTLGDSADSPRFVETVPRRGYRFIAPASMDRLSISPRTATAIRLRFSAARETRLAFPRRGSRHHYCRVCGSTVWRAGSGLRISSRRCRSRAWLVRKLPRPFRETVVRSRLRGRRKGCTIGSICM